ncbi:hypothetical protein pipiens_015711 [Culex pipiens pipiens]|uniref:CUB domain-containing protein n=1 Tax=Culex pipiens pipiens TaxID=38569 RepID=A0ABD1CP94_CULPP
MLWLIGCVLLCKLQLGASLSGVIANETALDLENEVFGLQDGVSSRQARYFPFYTIGRIANIPCTASNGLAGTCLIRGECAESGGLFGGNCSTFTNQATCCIFSKTCGGSTNLNSTYFTNRGYPGGFNDGGSCSFTISPCSSAVCQLRIDFRTLTLAQPNGDGECLTDVMTVTGGSSEVPPICGENSGQHVYVNFDELNPITIKIATSGGTSFSRLWNLQLQQINCDSRLRAPDGCLQYHLGTTGIISSFNYGTAANAAVSTTGLIGTRQLTNHRYGICIRSGPDKCTITYSVPSNGGRYAFTVSGDASVLDPLLIGDPLLLMNGEMCTEMDYVIIPAPSITLPNIVGFIPPFDVNFPQDRFCGLGWWPVTSTVKPFVFYVVWNENDQPDAANRGFRLEYTQNDCSVAG